MINRRTILSLATAAPIGVVGLGGLGGIGRAEAHEHAAVTRADAVHWIRAYARAWETKDADAAAQLFTEDAVYGAIPGVADQTFIGRSAIHAYWSSITAGQSNIVVRHGAPIVDRSRAMVELWVTMQVPALNPDGDHFVTLLETNVLYFANRQLVTRNFEYWNLLMGFSEPPAGWGEEALP
jgi:uncharacterized protein (TIGR02246 family)